MKREDNGEGSTKGGRAAPLSAFRVRSAFALLLAAALFAPVCHIHLSSLFTGDAGLPSKEAARAIFEPLLSNIYRAFDSPEEDDVFDALARSVDGPLLADLYRQIYGSLRQEEAAGEVGRVNDVELLAAKIHDVRRDEQGRPSFRVDAKWRVEGVVRHFGHAHVRRNRYRARFGVRRGPSGWRIADSQILEQRRLPGTPLPFSPPSASFPGASGR